MERTIRDGESRGPASVLARRATASVMRISPSFARVYRRYSDDAVSYGAHVIPASMERPDDDAAISDVVSIRNAACAGSGITNRSSNRPGATVVVGPSEDTSDGMRIDSTPVGSTGSGMRS